MEVCTGCGYNFYNLTSKNEVLFTVGYQPVCGFFEKEVRSQSSLCDKAYEFSSDEFPFPPIALP